MNRERFQSLSEKNNVEFAKYFSQKEFKQKHFQSGADDLCAGLVYLWIQYNIEKKNLLAHLKTPQSSLLEEIISIQRNSFYPGMPENQEDFRLSDADKILLKKKYGSDDWDFLMKKMQKAGAADFLELELIESFKPFNLNTRKYKDFPANDDFPLDLKEHRKTFFSLIIFRYLKGEKMTGHRMAYFKEPDGQHKFFDPNSGEIICFDSHRFRNWLKDFFANSKYKKRKPVPNQPFISFYEIEIG
ncbi:MAG: C58 family peptidase [Pyrinomonadaceae bacterium]|nr:C58 family peptidase [Pyrinomonadaceae bacterium]